MGLSGEMDGCGQFMKYSMFISNFIIFVGGLTVFGLGIWTVMDKSFVNELLGTNLFMGAVYIIIATGALVSLIAFFGCLGAIKEIKCMLLTYSLILFIILVVMLVGGILGYVFREKVRRSMEQEMNLSIKLYKEKRSIRRAWDDTQENLQCCGVNSYTDWRGEIPDSCCKEFNGQKRNCKTFPLSLNIHTQGCLNVTERYVKDHASIIAAAAVTVSSLMKLPCKTVQTSHNTHSQGCLNVTERYVKDHASIIGAAAVTVSSLMVLGLIFSLAMFKMIE